MTKITQGTGAHQRVGNKILLKQITFLLQFTSPGEIALAADVWNNIRFGICVCPKGFDNITPANHYASLWDPETGEQKDPHLYLRNLARTGTYKMVVDKRTRVFKDYIAALNSVGSNFIRTKKIKKKLNMTVEFESTNTAGNAVGVTKNYLFFWFYSDSTAAPHPAFRFSYRLRYIDV